jgi:hypothetical protein
MSGALSIGAIFQTLFGCHHRRITRPITPVRKPGVPSGETSVVCLDCGKQFAYDWNHMRIGKPIAHSPDSGVVDPKMPGPANTKLKYALIGSTIPFAIFLGSALVKKRRAVTPVKLQAEGGEAVTDASSGRRIQLPHRGAGEGFSVRELVDYIEQSGRDYIIVGDVDCALADHPKPASLDYWLRENFAPNKETKQATKEVIAQLLTTTLFEPAYDLRCPDTGNRSFGLRLKAGTQIQQRLKVP